jgi:hypothetical protein
MNMDTIAARKELIQEAMAKFEQDKLLNWPYITGFYASLLSSIAADRPRDAEYVVHCILANMEKSK